ncbi:hypothetical protein BDP81DRAFT_159167 [Colletotrichum phormii]|uniref:Uncharacterized protein n=1 Tax=Colletotrichum phormii TaxID=359342 RepID=A0AAJ0EIN5_9PEZI|nr:uncharacterized protein BDP81DRAFT_159167 [Colletotrichum phormii]KAK1640164.1 hypothetical protein BDP81DRAFT_159167 [Colletotrichum phormii]
METLFFSQTEWHRVVWRKRGLETESKTTFLSNEGLSKETRVPGELGREEGNREGRRDNKRQGQCEGTLEALIWGRGRLKFWMRERVTQRPERERERGVDKCAETKTSGSSLPTFFPCLALRIPCLAFPFINPLHPGTPSTKYICSSGLSDGSGGECLHQGSLGT